MTASQDCSGRGFSSPVPRPPIFTRHCWPPKKHPSCSRSKGTAQTRLLQILLSSPDGLSHAALDAAGTDQATRTVRSMLVEHGLLPLRDNNLARLEGWITSTAAKIPDTVERGAFIRFARWRHLRELRRRENPISTSLAVSRRREVRMIIDLLGWARQQGRTLADLSQTDIDRFRAAGPGDRHR